MPARRMPGVRWTWETLVFVSVCTVRCGAVDLQHRAELACAYETDLDRFAIGFELGEFG